MSKFNATQTIIVTVPESFRKDLQELTDVIEGPMSPTSPWTVDNIIEVILEAPPDKDEWSNYDGNLIVKFIKEK